jgi:hypothetical protein
MTDERSNEGTGGAGAQQFLVDQGGKLYIAQVMQEADPQDETVQAALREAGDAGTAIPYPGGPSAMEYKASFAQIEPQTEAQIEPPQQ